MRRRTVRAAVGVGVGVVALTSVLAGPAAAPRVHRTITPHTIRDCMGDGWQHIPLTTYASRGECIAAAAQTGQR